MRHSLALRTVSTHMNKWKAHFSFFDNQATTTITCSRREVISRWLRASPRWWQVSASEQKKALLKKLLDQVMKARGEAGADPEGGDWVDLPPWNLQK